MAIHSTMTHAAKLAHASEQHYCLACTHYAEPGKVVSWCQAGVPHFYTEGRECRIVRWDNGVRCPKWELADQCEDYRAAASEASVPAIGAA